VTCKVATHFASGLRFMCTTSLSLSLQLGNKSVNGSVNSSIN